MKRTFDRSDSVGQHPTARVCRVSDSMPHSSKENHECRLEGIWKQDGEVKMTQSNIPSYSCPIGKTRWFIFAPHFVDKWRGSEQSCNPRTNEQRYVGSRKVFAKRFDCRNGEEGIAN